MRTSIDNAENVVDGDCGGVSSFGDVEVTQRVRGWFSGFVSEMRKKSPATIQKWVDSIATDDVDDETCRHTSSGSNPIENASQSIANKEEILDESIRCNDGDDFKIDDDATTTTSKAENLKVKLNEICNKLNVNETLRNKRCELKNLITKTSLKLKREESSTITTKDHQVEEESQIDPPPMEEQTNDKKINETKAEEVEVKNSILTAQRARIGVLGRSSSENPRPRHKRLSDIGRSFSVSNENELPGKEKNTSNENLIFDLDEDISITIPSLNTSSTLSNSNNATSQNLSQTQQLPPQLISRSSLLQIKPARQHTVSESHASPIVQSNKNPLLRDSSFQSDSSHCSSVESLLEARKPDAEAILMNLGFGPVKGADDVVSKIPKRFLKPSQCSGVDTDSFLRNQQLSMNIHETSVLGYRGLLGSSHVPSDIVKAIIERFSINEVRRMDSTTTLDCGRSFKGVAQTVLAQRHFMK